MLILKHLIKSKVFTDIVSKPVGKVEKADTAKDALSVSLNETGVINFDRMKELTGKSKETLIKELGRLIYLDPRNNKYVTESEYLSGNVRDKLTIARNATKGNPDYQINVDALKKVQPKPVPAIDIEVRIGANWVGREAVRDFAAEIFEDGRIKIGFSPVINEWTVEAFTANDEILKKQMGN